MEGKMTESALLAKDTVRATSFFQELVFESSARNPPPVDSIIPPSASLSSQIGVINGTKSLSPPGGVLLLPSSAELNLYFE